jgi:hypothetical protein
MNKICARCENVNTVSFYEAEHIALLPGRLWDRHVEKSRTGGQVSSSHMVRLNYSERSLRKTNPTPLHFLPAQASVSLLLSGETRVFLSFSS